MKTTIIGFGSPQVDVCSECERLGTKLKASNLNDHAKTVAAADFRHMFLFFFILDSFGSTHFKYTILKKKLVIL